ncbi:hypothetical protein CBL_08599 [Carabus blaptoides fortunei]
MVLGGTHFAANMLDHRCLGQRLNKQKEEAYAFIVSINNEFFPFVLALTSTSLPFPLDHISAKQVQYSPAKDGNLDTVSSNAECPTKLRLTKLNEKNYCVSPIHSTESDVDDSDADPNFNSSWDSSSSSISDSAKELVEVEVGLCLNIKI